MFTINQAAKLLQTGEKKLFKKLRQSGVLGNDNLPKQTHISAGRFVVSQREYHHPVVGQKYYGVTMVTDKGLNWLRESMQSETERKAS